MQSQKFKLPLKKIKVSLTMIFSLLITLLLAIIENLVIPSFIQNQVLVNLEVIIQHVIDRIGQLLLRKIRAAVEIIACLILAFHLEIMMVKEKFHIKGQDQLRKVQKRLHLLFQLNNQENYLIPYLFVRKIGCNLKNRIENGWQWSKACIFHLIKEQNKDKLRKRENVLRTREFSEMEDGK